MRNEPAGGKDKMGKGYGGRIMIENMERMVLLSLLTPICDRPLPSGGFSRKADLLLPL